MIFPGFIGPAYENSFSNITCDRTINLMVERDLSGHSKNPENIALVPTPGLRFIALGGIPQPQGIMETGGRCFIVGAGRLVELKHFTNYDQAGHPTDGWAVEPKGSAGGESADQKPVSFAATKDQLLFAISGSVYLFNIGTEDPPLNIGALADYHTVTAIDGYFLAAKRNSQQFNISGLNDGASWDPLEFDRKQGADDPIECLTALNRELWIFGSASIEVWTNTGRASFPFERTPSGFIEMGTDAGPTVQVMDNAIYFLGGDRRGRRIVWESRGLQPKRISNHGMETAIQSYRTVSDASAYTYQQNGHSFYVLTFPTENRTWVYDITTGSWHERLFWDPVHAQWKEYRARYHAYCFGQHIVTDRKTASLYTIDPTWGYDAIYQPRENEIGNPAPLRRVRRAPHLAREMKKLFYSRLQVDAQVALGDGSSPDQLNPAANPQMTLAYSNDGGKTMAVEQLRAAIGRQGEYLRQIYWNRLGSARDRVFEVGWSDPAVTAITAAYLEVR